PGGAGACAKAGLRDVAAARGHHGDAGGACSPSGVRFRHLPAHAFHARADPLAALCPRLHAKRRAGRTCPWRWRGGRARQSGSLRGDALDGLLAGALPGTDDPSLGSGCGSLRVRYLLPPAYGEDRRECGRRSPPLPLQEQRQHRAARPDRAAVSRCDHPRAGPRAGGPGKLAAPTAPAFHRPPPAGLLRPAVHGRAGAFRVRCRAQAICLHRSRSRSGAGRRAGLLARLLVRCFRMGAGDGGSPGRDDRSRRAFGRSGSLSAAAGGGDRGRGSGGPSRRCAALPALPAGGAARWRLPCPSRTRRRPSREAARALPPVRPRYRKPPSLMNDRIARIAFYAACLILAVGYGILSVRWNWFPNPQIALAERTVNDLRANWKNDVGLEPSRHLVDSRRPRTEDASETYRVHREGAAEPGFTLISGLSQDQDLAAHAATLYSESGDVVHVWPVDYELILPGGLRGVNVMLHGV